MKKQILKLIKSAKANVGFTMIELLIVIAILGILAVAVLSAINPVEQINRGRDTGSRSDAEQFISAVDRFNAFQGYYPWQTGASDTDDTGLAITSLSAAGVVADDNTCTLDEKLSTATTAGCTGSDELKTTFFTRIFDSGYNYMSIYNNGSQGDSTYVCFVPKSKAFITEAQSRCTDAAGSGLPADVDATTKGTLCSGWADPTPADPVWVCLP